MSQPRRHHYVQAEHIRQFTNAEGLVWVYSKDGKQFSVKPEAIYFKRDLNSYETAEGLDTQFEDFVTAIENDTFPAVSRTIEQGKIAKEDLIALTGYMALSRIRNPTLQKGSIDFHRQTVATVAKISERRGALKDSGDFPGYPGKSLTQLIQEGVIEIEINNVVYLDKIIGMMQQTHKILASAYGWSLVTSKTDRVIISDHPLTFVHPGKDFGLYGIPMGGDDCEIAFPLSKRHYLLGLWQHQAQNIESEDLVDELNKRQALFASRQIASGYPKRCWQELALKYRHYSFQTRADTLDLPDSAYHMMTGGVFPVDSKVISNGSHPLKRTRSVRSLARLSTAPI